MTFILAALGLAGAVWTAGAADAPSFALKKFNSTETVQLKDFAGQIVVLDFFAYWCAPCQKSAPELEEKIQKHYQSAPGHPHGSRVSVVSINVEREKPSKTAAFIERYKPSLVLNDDEGKILEAYGGAGLPFLVVLDGTKSTVDSPRFEIVYRKSGFEGAVALQKVIDALGTKSTQP